MPPSIPILLAGVAITIAAIGVFRDFQKGPGVGPQSHAAVSGVSIQAHRVIFSVVTNATATAETTAAAAAAAAVAAVSADAATAAAAAAAAIAAAAVAAAAAAASTVVAPSSLPLLSSASSSSSAAAAAASAAAAAAAAENCPSQFDLFIRQSCPSGAHVPLYLTRSRDYCWDIVTYVVSVTYVVPTHSFGCRALCVIDMGPVAPNFCRCFFFAGVPHACCVVFAVGCCCSARGRGQ